MMSSFETRRAPNLEVFDVIVQDPLLEALFNISNSQ